ncbi:nickel ABC transporter ATP-binding protein NikE [Acuticoccus sp. M5D2P5]|uniref:nickel ABC transporter ATP-binding protein NikE n=1 Tax=Acuticoccus kalidii TaxID=2910977 RepID=UPI001F166A23|nr:nickel ABC transporter ATP-binding protein NikE [Acuticoccus kalidii]MCF3934083.1 nickel ABC transporter ATP-binding protein NikE [Acuticoccus kalidii]
MSLLSAHNVSRFYGTKTFAGGGRERPALSKVSMTIEAGETVALLGRSGCGKSTLSRLLVGLDTPDEGDIRFRGESLRSMGRAGWQELRRTVQMVFQDPIGAVDPRATVGDIIAEPLRPLCGLVGRAARDRVHELLLTVALRADDADKLPQQLSGGQLQRVCIARALAPRPRLVILDEAVSNLDLHLQIRMLDLFAALQRDHDISFLFVTHDLRLVERICSRLLVMDGGRIAERAPVNSPLELASPEGKALANAILPALPLR